MFNYLWNKSDYPATHGKTVMSTFACGGGSTMGYKLAGYDVIAANDIDKQMAKVYHANHHPKHYFLCDIRELITKDDLPEELYKLDILDGSPPCSVFSMAGQREEAWGKEKKFREGQAKQTLDDLFFHFIDLAKKLQPKIVVSENVKGLLHGNAKGYVKAIVAKFEQAGYDTQIFLLNGATMGVPQKRERVFFISRRRDLNLPKITLNFNQEQIVFGKIRNNKPHKLLTVEIAKYWQWCRMNMKADFGKYAELKFGKRKMFNHRIIFDNKVCDTIASNCQLTIDTQPAYLNNEELVSVGSFPTDYDFMEVKPSYLIGMSVPPLMIAGVAEQIKNQWLDKIV